MNLTEEEELARPKNMKNRPTVMIDSGVSLYTYRIRKKGRNRG